jgi:hypothetical protein
MQMHMTRGLMLAPLHCNVGRKSLPRSAKAGASLWAIKPSKPRSAKSRRSFLRIFQCSFQQFIADAAPLISRNTNLVSSSIC